MVTRHKREMMYRRTIGILLIVFLLTAFGDSGLQAQCSMCTLNAEQSVQGENTQGKGLNDGILFLLAMPYLAVGVIGFIWYKRYRRRSGETVDVKDPISLN